MTRMTAHIVFVVSLFAFAASAHARSKDGAAGRVASELQCLALNIYFEARGEPQEGQFAVGLVTLNRVRTKGFPDTVCKVVWQKGWVRKFRRYRPQFSWTLDGKSDRPRDKRAWEVARKIAYLVYFTDLYDFTDGAVFYHANYVKPRWRTTQRRVTRIGKHIFYRPRKS